MDDGYTEETCGYLWVKQPSKSRKTKLKKAWKRKWVLLQHSGDHVAPTTRLRIFSDKDSYSKSKKCEHVITIEKSEHVRRSKSSSQSYAFVIRSEEPQIFLAGGSETDAQTWMKAMRNSLLGEPYDLVNLNDRFVVYVIDNEYSEKLQLSGAYYLSITRTKLTLTSVTDQEACFTWTTSSLKRFELVAVKCALDRNKILRILSSKESESGEGKFRFFTSDAEAILRAIYRNLFRRMSRKHKSESKSQRSSNDSESDKQSDKPVSVISEDEDLSLNQDPKKVRDNSRNICMRSRTLPEPPTLCVSSADESSIAGDDDSIFEFDSRRNSSVCGIPKIVLDDGAKQLFSPTSRAEEMCDALDLSGLNSRFVQAPRSARTSVSSSFTADSDSQDNLGSDDSGEKTPFINPYAISYLFVNENREKSTSRDTIIAETSENSEILREKSRSGTLTNDESDQLIATGNKTSKAQLVSAYLSVEGAHEHVRAARCNVLKPSHSSLDLSTRNLPSHHQEFAASAPLPRKYLKGLEQDEYQSDNDSGSDYYDTIDSDDDDAFNETGVESLPYRRKFSTRLNLSLRRESEVSSQYENIYDFLDNHRRQSQASYGCPSPDVKHISAPPPLPPRPPTLLLQYSSLESLFAKATESTNTEGECPDSDIKPNRFSQIMTTQKWRRRVIKSHHKKSTPSSEDDHDVEDAFDLLDSACDMEATVDLDAPDKDNSALSKSDENTPTPEKSTPHPFDLGHLVPLTTQFTRRGGQISSCSSPVTDTVSDRKDSDERETSTTTDNLIDSSSEITSTYKLITNVVKENWAEMTEGEFEEEYVTRDSVIDQVLDGKESENDDNESSVYGDEDEIYVSMDTSPSDVEESVSFGELWQHMSTTDVFQSNSKHFETETSPINEKAQCKSMSEAKHDSNSSNKYLEKKSPQDDSDLYMRMSDIPKVINRARERVQSVEVTSL